MSRRTYVDMAKEEERQTLSAMKNIGLDHHVRIAPNTEAAIQLVAEWKKNDKVPQGMNLAAMQALLQISYIRRNVDVILRRSEREATPHVGGNGHVPKAPAGEMPLLSEEQIRERSEVGKKNRAFVESFVNAVASPSELETWASFFGQFISPPTEGQIQKIASIYTIASKIPGGPGLLQSMFKNIKWAQISHSAQNVRNSDHFTAAVAAAQSCAQEAGISLSITPPTGHSHESNGHAPNALLSRFTQTVQEELERCGLAEDLVQYERKYTNGTFVRIPKNVAQTYAVFVDELRLRDPNGLAAFQAHFKSLPWDFVEDFTEVKTVERAVPTPPAAPRISATAALMQAGQKLQERAFETVTHPPATAITAVSTEETPTAEQAAVPFVPPANTDGMTETEAMLLEPLLALEKILEGADRSAETNARILLLVQKYAASLVRAVALHGEEAMTPYLNITDAADFATNIEAPIRRETKKKIVETIKIGRAHV